MIEAYQRDRPALRQKTYPAACSDGSDSAEPNTTLRCEGGLSGEGRWKGHQELVVFTSLRGKLPGRDVSTLRLLHYIIADGKSLEVDRDLHARSSSQMASVPTDAVAQVDHGRC